MEWRVYEHHAHDDYPSARMGHTATLVDAEESWGEKLLVVFGGLSAEKEALGDVHVFQVETQAWISPNIPTVGPAARSFHGAAAQQTNIFIFGGHVFSKERTLHKFADLWCLNTDTWTWTQISCDDSAICPSPRDFFTFITLPGGRILLYAGLDGTEKKLSDTWIFDTTVQTWQELDLASRPKPRHGHAMARIDHQVLMCGGDTLTGAANDIWALRGVVHPSQQEPPCWVQLDIAGNPFSARKANTVVGTGMQVVVFGGHTSESGWFSRRQEVYHSDIVVLERQGSVSWQRPAVTGPPPAAREFHTLTPVSPTKFLLLGGGNGRVIFKDAYWLLLPERQPQNMQPSKHSVQQTALSWPRNPSDAALLLDASLASASDMSIAQAIEDPGKATEKPQTNTGKQQIRKEFERLCQVLGAADCNAEYSSALDAEAFEHLGREILRQPAFETLSPADLGQNAELTSDLARQYLSKQETQDLRIRDVAALLWDYKQISPGLQLQDATLAHILAALDPSDAKHRFSHRKAESLSVAEVRALHAEYKRLVMGLA